jgi:hypothetical protein
MGHFSRAIKVKYFDIKASGFYNAKPAKPPYLATPLTSHSCIMTRLVIPSELWINTPLVLSGNKTCTNSFAGQLEGHAIFAFYLARSIKEFFKSLLPRVDDAVVCPLL